MRWQCLSFMGLMEELVEEEPGEVLDALSMLTDRLLPVCQYLESLYVTEGVTSKEIQ
jgi:hypothetical protein